MNYTVEQVTNLHVTRPLYYGSEKDKIKEVSGANIIISGVDGDYTVAITDADEIFCMAATGNAPLDYEVIGELADPSL
jgi:hypothetical protein